MSNEPTIYIRDGKTYIITSDGVEVVPRDGDKHAIAKAAGRGLFDSEEFLRQRKEDLREKPTPGQPNDYAKLYYQHMLRSLTSMDGEYKLEDLNGWEDWLGEGGW